MAGQGKKKIGSLEESRRRNFRILLAVGAVVVLAVAGVVVVKLGTSNDTAGSATVTTSPQPALVDAGVIGVDGSALHRTLPVNASATTPVNFPRSGLATAGPIAAAIPDALGIGASVGTGTT